MRFPAPMTLRAGRGENFLRGSRAVSGFEECGGDVARAGGGVTDGWNGAAVPQVDLNRDDSAQRASGA